MAEEIKHAGKDQVKRSASEEELSVSFSGPAIAANRMFVTVGAGGARIAFTEQQGRNPPAFRTAVILPIQDAIALKNLLADLLKDVEEKIAVLEEQDG